MKGYTVIITDQTETSYYIEAANSPEEAEAVASELHEEFYEDSDYEVDVIDSQVTDVIPDEDGEEIS